MNYRSSTDVWKEQFPGALIVMALTFMFFNTIQWTSLYSQEAWPYGSSFVTLMTYLLSQVLEMKIAIFTGVIVGLVLIGLFAMKISPIIKSAFSPSYKRATILIVLLFTGAFVALPILGLWAFADIVIYNPHVYINTVIPTLAGSIYFSGKTLAAAQFAETRTRATDAVEQDVFEGQGDEA